MYSNSADHHRKLILPFSLNHLNDINKSSSIQIIDVLQPGTKYDDLELDMKRQRNIAFSSILSPELSKTHT